MKDVIDCIPSKALRDYLNIHPLELSVLQEATIVSEYATRKNRSHCSKNWRTKQIQRPKNYY